MVESLEDYSRQKMSLGCLVFELGYSYAVPQITRTLLKSSVFGLGLVLCFQATAQVNVQKYKISRLSFQFRSNNNTNTRCLFWFPLEADEQPRVRYTDQGEPFLKVQVRARVTGECALKLSPPETIVASKDVDDADPDIRFFDVVVNPLLATAQVVGPNFKDELIFEAPIERLESIGFFNFFSKSKLFFESRYSTLKTSNPRFPDTKANVFPVVGGAISVPFPWVPSLFAGYSMYQSLGNLVASDSVNVQLSEFTFDLRYQWRGPESWGRPAIVPLVIDYRGRNLYQPGLSDADRPFVIGSFAMIGFGAEASWYFGALMAPWTSWVSRLGVDAATRFYVGGKISGRKTTAMIFDGGLSYRLGSKWAVGAGYNLTTQRTDFPELAAGYVSEPMSSFFLRLQLVPHLEGKSK